MAQNIAFHVPPRKLTSHSAYSGTKRISIVNDVVYRPAYSAFASSNDDN